MTNKRTKIVCTMGPATESDEVLRGLIEGGMNVARFNFSHGSHDYHRNNIECAASPPSSHCPSPSCSIPRVPRSGPASF